MILFKIPDKKYIFRLQLELGAIEWGMSSKRWLSPWKDSREKPVIYQFKIPDKYQFKIPDKKYSLRLQLGLVAVGWGHEQ